MTIDEDLLQKKKRIEKQSPTIKRLVIWWFVYLTIRSSRETKEYRPLKYQIFFFSVFVSILIKFDVVHACVCVYIHIIFAHSTRIYIFLLRAWLIHSPSVAMRKIWWEDERNLNNNSSEYTSFFLFLPSRFDRIVDGYSSNVLLSLQDKD